jgi:pentatricopeptide repeat protein
MVAEGEKYFEAMSDDYGLIPTVDHYTCMIDLLGRAGHLQKAVSMIQRMPMQPDLVVLHTLLGACRKWGEVEFGRLAFEHALRIDRKSEATYMYMFNIYSDASMHGEARKVEAMRAEVFGHGSGGMDEHGIVIE